MDGAPPHSEATPAPRIDTLDLAARLPARLVDSSATVRLPCRALAPLDRATRFALGHALAAVRQLGPETRTVLSMSEDVGVPLALLLAARHAALHRPAPRHILIAHSLLSPAKLRLYRALRVMPRFHRILLMDPDAPAAVAAAYGLPPERVRYLPNGVDRAFWRPDPAGSPAVDPARAIAVGRARRDYATLLEAVAGTPVRLDLHASSQWHVAYPAALGAPPPNVTVTTDYLDYPALRERIDQAAFAVVPLLPGAHASAGSVTVLQAMAMAKPVVLAVAGGRSPLVQEGVTGLVVPAGDAGALRSAILRLAAAPDETRAMGRRALDWVAANADHDDRIDRLVAHLTEVQES